MLAGNDFADAEDLTVGTELLNGQFLIQSRLRSGGFGVTYIARDSLARQVVVKECFPSGLCTRKGTNVYPASEKAAGDFHAIKSQFIREARQLAKLVHPGIVAVHQVFEENNTAYMALDKINGMDFVTVSEERPELLTKECLHSALQQCLTAIGFIHQNHVLHRDVSPDNIMIDDNGHVTLIDFGASKEHADQSRPAMFAVKDGYSPYEFYTPKSKHDFASDFYALGATFHYLVTGTPPPDSLARLKALTSGKADPYEPLVKGEWPFDYNILVTIDRALKMRQRNRYQSAAQWLEDLEAQPKKHPLPRAMVRFDPNLENEIARIVEITNTQMGGDGTGGKLTVRNRTRGKKDAPPEKKPLVDIFGNPINDFDRWQRDQETEIERRASASSGSTSNSGQINPTTGRAGKLISRLIHRCFSRNHGADSAPSNS
ncbi:MAG: serine/threonine-protein kinase [Roseobacter sp.]